MTTAPTTSAAWTLTYPGRTATHVGDILGPNEFDEYLAVTHVTHVGDVTKVGVRIASRHEANAHIVQRAHNHLRVIHLAGSRP